MRIFSEGHKSRKSHRFAGKFKMYNLLSKTWGNIIHNVLALAKDKVPRKYVERGLPVCSPDNTDPRDYVTYGKS